MSPTQRSTWPSADLWKRIAAGGIADETECPVCGCPAAGHYRDQAAKVLFCPDPKEAEKLKVMLKRAKAPNPDVTTRDKVGLNTAEWADEGRREAAAEIERLKAVYPDFEELRPYINRIVSTVPNVSLETAIVKARELLARNQLRENEAAIARQEFERRRRAEQEQYERVRRAPRQFIEEGGELPRSLPGRFGAPVIPKPPVYPLDGEDGDEPAAASPSPAKPAAYPSWESQLYRPYRGEEPKPAAPKERQAGEVTKRAYFFDEE